MDFMYCCVNVCLKQVNKTVENIGARRLHTIMERIVEEISFDAPDHAGGSFEVKLSYLS